MRHKTACVESMSVDGRRIRIRVSNIDSGRQSPSIIPHVFWSRTEARMDIQMSIFRPAARRGYQGGSRIFASIGEQLSNQLSGKRGRSMWTTLFTVVLVLAATLNVLAIVTEYLPPD